jgi:hypothetical protein
MDACRPETRMSDRSQNLPVAPGRTIRPGDTALAEDDRRALEKAVNALEHTNIATRLANTVGRQLGAVGRFLPPGVSGLVNRATENAIKSALKIAVGSIADKPLGDSRLRHKALAAASGAIGGAFGLSSLPVELPVSTIILLRSIADIARNEGEDPRDPDVGLACLQVFALGAHENSENFMEGGYYATRGLLAKTVSEASRHLLSYGLGDQSAPALVRLVSQIGSRFGVVVSEKLAAQAVPLIGAAGGAAVNYAFAEHFQSLAFGHFTVRRLERRYGGDLVRAEYDRLLAAQRETADA